MKIVFWLSTFDFRLVYLFILVKYLMTPFHIRKARPGDMPDVLQLITELAIFEREPDAVVITAEDLQRDGFSGQPLFHCFVAEHESNIVGMALYYYRYSTWKGKTIHLEDLIVTEEMRGTGLGSALY